MRSAMREVVDGARRELAAASGLAADEDRRIARRQPAKLGEETAEDGIARAKGLLDSGEFSDEERQLFALIADGVVERYS